MIAKDLNPGRKITEDEIRWALDAMVAKNDGKPIEAPSTQSKQ